MKKFEFELESALRFKEVQLDLEQNKLMQLKGIEQTLKNSLDTLGRERKAAFEALRHRQEIDSVQLRTLSAYLIGCQTRITSLSDQLLLQRHHVQKQTQTVVNAERNWRLLTKLREKRHSEWAHEVDRQIEANAQEAWLSTRKFRSQA